VPALRLAVFGALVGTTATGSPLSADVITPSGLVPFWPLSRAHYTLDITRADNGVANALLLTLGVLVAALSVLVAEPSVLWLFR
jgi:inner membrane protein